MFELYAVKLTDEILKINPEVFYKFLPEEKVARLKRFFRKEDMMRTLIGDIVTRWLIAKKVKKNPEDLMFVKDTHDKPLLKQIENVHFNISHSGVWIICGIDETPLGIDIEEIKNIDLRIAKRFFSEKEYAELMKKEDDLKTEYFYELWTLKESYIKSTGKGLNTPLSSFSIIKEKNIIKIELEDNYIKYFFKQYDIDTKYKMAVCSMNDNFPENIIFIDFIEIYKQVINGEIPAN